ncbi:MAG TPA: ABC transporter permease [Anaerolineae bacterium]
MIVLENVRNALSALASNRLRSVLTMLGVVIGTAAVITLLSVGQGVESYINDQFTSLGTNLLFVWPRLGGSQRAQFTPASFSQTTLTERDAGALGDPLRVPDASDVAPLVRLDAIVRYGRQDIITTVRGVGAEYAAIRGFQAASGRTIGQDDVLTRARVAVIGMTVLDELFGPDVEPLGKTVRINDVPFRVVGTLEERGGNQFANDDNQIMVPITAAQGRLADLHALNGLPGVSMILLQATASQSMDAVKSDSTTTLRDTHNISYRDDDDFRILSQNDLLATFGQISAAITVFLGAIAGISLVVGGIGIMNIMLVTVTERTREIGLRKAIGAKRRDILLQFLVESMTLALVGGLLGIAIGVTGATAIAGLSQEFQPRVSLITIALSTGMSVLVGLFAGLYPALRAARLNPIEALRYE